MCLGPKERCRADTFRCVGGLLAKWLGKREVRRAELETSDVLDPLASPGAALIEGLYLGSFRFDCRKSAPAKTPELRVNWVVGASAARVRRKVARIEALCDGVNLARELSHEPPNVLHPVALAERITRVARRAGLRCTVLNERDLKRLGAGAMLAVGQGSDSPPRLVVLEHGVTHGSRGRARRGTAAQTAQSRAPVALIGKAITFDTGGYSLKDRVGMVGMKYDKCGGMAVLGAMCAASKLNLRTPVVAVIAIAENMVSGGAYRPNDIITTLAGKTVEIISADAEGRLVLADAMTYAQRNYHPRCMIDVATLTGGVLVALGSLRAGLMSNDDGLCEALFAAGERTHERLWRLPLDDEYFELIQGDDSDFKNSGERGAQAIVGGIFLKQFVENGTPWAHLDVAAVSQVDRDAAYCPKGATGFGVRLLIEYLSGLEES